MSYKKAIIIAVLFLVVSTSVLKLEGQQDQVTVKGDNTNKTVVFHTARQCKLCHSQQYQQWLGSMKNYSFVSPTFNAFEMVTARLNPAIRTEAVLIPLPTSVVRVIRQQ
jgi:hypothetical protein